MTKENSIDRRGLMIALSSPSGAGKTSIAEGLLSRDVGLSMSVSVTTRPPRPGEIPGIDYHFVSMDEFQSMKEANHFLEWAQVFSHFYGTPRDWVLKTLDQGQDVLFDIDWQGVQIMGQMAPQDLVTVFVLPPCRDALYRRLMGRGQDNIDVIENRMAKASSEMGHWAEYDYVIVNENLHDAIDDVYAILRSERLKRGRQTGLLRFVRHLQREHPIH